MGWRKNCETDKVEKRNAKGTGYSLFIGVVLFNYPVKLLILHKCHGIAK